MSLIEQLAGLVGFHANYYGTFGDQIQANKQAQKALLSAMGFKLDNKSLLKSINNLKQKQWLNILPPVHIAKTEEQQHTMLISLPKISGVLVNWKITLELADEPDSSSELLGSINVNDMVCTDEAEIEGTLYGKYQFLLPKLSQGYHKLNLSFDHQVASCVLIYAPKTCFSPQEASVKKVWGYTAQLYSLRSNDNWGIGDYSDLYKLVENAVEQEAAIVGLNPLHPLYQANPAHRSPYSPSSRSFLNPLYIDVTKIPNFKDCKAAQEKFNSAPFQHALSDARNSDLVNYPEVAKLKYAITELLFDDFCLHSTHTYQEMARAFERFKQNSANDLQQFATFDALYEHFNLADINAYGWQDWPTAFQDPDSKAVHKFQLANAKRIDYFCFLQWIADQQLRKISQYSLDNNMAIGLYLDLAVGCDGSGFDVWSDKNLYVPGASIGAPPDAMNPLGQNWGLTPINPLALQAHGYQPLVKALRSSMQYAGALRIDHILGLMRQYWVAPTMEATEGIYISFPWDDILRIIALESRRNRCVVIGEDLGNVPEGFSETIQNAGLQSFKVLFFERWQSGLFKRPENFPSQSIITIATHDTATLSGWWQGRDLAWRQQLNLYPNEAAGEADRNARPNERCNLIAALADLNVIDLTKAPSQAPAKMNTELSTAVQKYLAKSPSHIQLIPLEDMLEMSEQVNIPGTIDQHPNWLQKLPVTLESYMQTPSVEAISHVMNEARPKN